MPVICLKQMNLSLLPLDATELDAIFKACRESFVFFIKCADAERTTKPEINFVIIMISQGLHVEESALQKSTKKPERSLYSHVYGT